ncbi:MAG TPA: hypothetical protein VJA21_16135 [Verrucomicrobiae bacterium]
MKTATIFSGKLMIAVGLVGALFGTTPVQGGLQIPYTPNASTLHLWHLDDPDGLYAT